MLLELDVQEVIAKLGFGDPGRIASEVFVHQTHLTVIGVPGPIGVVTQAQEIGEVRHRLVRMLVIDGIGILAPGGADGGGDRSFGPLLAAGVGRGRDGGAWPACAGLVPGVGFGIAGE